MRKKNAKPIRSDFSSEDPMLLEVAAGMAFPDGSMTRRRLLKEWSRGTLECERIADNYYTSLNAIEKMREKCRELPKVRDYGSANEMGATRFGSSSTQDNLSAARASAEMIAMALKKGSRNT